MTLEQVREIMCTPKFYTSIIYWRIYFLESITLSKDEKEMTINCIGKKHTSFIEDMDYNEFTIINAILPPRELPFKWDEDCINLPKY